MRLQGFTWPYLSLRALENLNISNFDAHVYREWNLPKALATKIQTWVSINVEKLDKVHNR